MMNYGYANPYQPMLSAQQRIGQFEQQYPHLTQCSSQNFITIPVTNIQEANAFRVDLNGTPTFFYNAGNNEVYMKRTNTQTGSADFVLFSKVEPTKDESKLSVVANDYEEDFKVLNKKIDDLHSLLTNVSSHNNKNEEKSEQVNKGGKSVK